MLSEGLKLLIGNDAAVSALIGQRFFPIAAPPELMVFPYVVYKKVRDNPEYTLDRKQYSVRYVQFEAFSPIVGDCERVLKAVQKVLDTFSGTLSDADATVIMSAIREDALDEYNSDSRIPSVWCEYKIEYLEK